MLCCVVLCFVVVAVCLGGGGGLFGVGFAVHELCCGLSFLLTVAVDVFFGVFRRFFFHAFGFWIFIFC